MEMAEPRCGQEEHTHTQFCNGSLRVNNLLELAVPCKHCMGEYVPMTSSWWCQTFLAPPKMGISWLCLFLWLVNVTRNHDNREGRMRKALLPLLRE